MTETILNHQHTLQAIKSHSKEPDKKNSYEVKAIEKNYHRGEGF